MVRQFLDTIDKSKRILEIGPRASPIIQKDNINNNIFYADIRSTEEIKKYYSDNNAVYQ